MNTWRSLLWKEWREQRAVGLAILAVLVLVPTITSFADMGGLHFGIYFTTILTMPMFAVFVGMGIASGEHSRGTMPFLQALPATTHRSAAAKLFAGLLTLWLPILAATVLYAGWIELTEERSRLFTDVGFARAWGITNTIVAVGVASLLLASSMLIWTVAAGANRKDEISAGAMAIVTIVAAYGILFGFLWLLSKITSDPSYLRQDGWLHPLIAGLPGVCAFTSYPNGATSLGGQSWFGHFGPYLIVTLISHVLFIGIFLNRYGRDPARELTIGLQRSASKQHDWLSPPLRSAFRAVGWKALREVSPLLLAGIAITLGIALIFQISQPTIDWREVAFGLWGYIGGFVSIALGIGVFREDLEPGLHNFWRSRPASVSGWFWTKFSLAVGLLAVFGLGMGWLGVEYRLDQTERIPLSDYDGWEQVLRAWVPSFGVILVHAGLYVVAALLMILVRRPIFAAVMDVGLLIGAVFLSEYIFRWIGPTDWNGLVIGIPLVLLCMAGVAILAWQAFKKNWSLENWLG